MSSVVQEKQDQSTKAIQDACNSNNNEIPQNLQTIDGFKKPHLKMLNLMKPSLSLTSLPPQSPKEQNEDTTSTIRPYNSLKVNINQFFLN